MEATQSTAAEIVLNPQVQVVAPAMYQAFRRADMLNNIIAKSLRSNRYRLKNIFSWPVLQVTINRVYRSYFGVSSKSAIFFVTAPAVVHGGFNDRLYSSI